MNSEWSLDVLYKGFDDPKFSEDLTSFEKKAKELDELSKTLSHENEKEDLRERITEFRITEFRSAEFRPAGARRAKLPKAGCDCFSG